MRRSILALCFLIAGCTAPDDKDKIVQLEKQVHDLQGQMSSQQRAVDLDLQAKCGKDAEAYFNRHYQLTRDDTLLTFSNHYNKAANGCFILVQHKFWMDAKQNASS